MGRDRELIDLHQSLQEADRVAIAAVGMGGIGKTTLAQRYVKQHRADYPGGIWWVAAERLVTLVSEYAGRLTELEELPKDWSEVRVVQHYLAHWERLFPQRKLLVLDNVGEYAAVKDFLPAQGAFQVLMTTRVQMPSPVKRFVLGVLAPPAALQLWRELLADDVRLEAAAEAMAVCEWLGYLPLGIELGAQLLRIEPDWSIAKLLTDLKREQMQHESMSAVEAAFELSWQQLSRAESQLAAVLGLFAVAPIPWALVKQVIDQYRVVPPRLSGWKQILRRQPPESEQWCELLEDKVLLLTSVRVKPHLAKPILNGVRAFSVGGNRQSDRR